MMIQKSSTTEELKASNLSICVYKELILTQKSKQEMEPVNGWERK